MSVEKNEEKKLADDEKVFRFIQGIFLCRYIFNARRDAKYPIYKIRTLRAARRFEFYL